MSGPDSTLWKKIEFRPKMITSDPVSERCKAISIGRWSTPKVSNCVYGSSRIRIKCFWGNLRHLDAILSHLKFGQKIRILAVLAPKTLEKATQLYLSSAKKGATLHFKRLKIFSLKNSAKIDEFCTLCEFLTPNAEAVGGGLNPKQIWRFGTFCWHI